MDWKSAHIGHLATILVITACGGNARTEGASDVPKDIPAVVAAVQCDPLVGEFHDLMADYETGLKEMVAAKRVDEARQQEWSERANSLSERIKVKGEKELGMKCWSQFNAISQEYAPRIAELGMRLAMVQMEGKGIDPAMMEQMKQAMGQ